MFLKAAHSQSLETFVPLAFRNLILNDESTQSDVVDVVDAVGDAVGAGVVPVSEPMVISNVIVDPAALIFEIVISVSMIDPLWYAFVFG